MQGKALSCPPEFSTPHMRRNASRCNDGPVSRQTGHSRLFPASWLLISTGRLSAEEQATSGYGVRVSMAGMAGPVFNPAEDAFP